MTTTKTGQSRRDVLKLGAVSVPAAAAAVAGTAVPAGAHDHDKAEPVGLRPTEHTRKFWDTARW